jgi:hypothetical protein
MTKGLDGIQVTLVDSVEKANEFIAWLSERRPHNAIAIDTETGERPGRPREDALSPWHGDLRLVQVGWNAWLVNSLARMVWCFLRSNG